MKKSTLPACLAIAGLAISSAQASVVLFSDGFDSGSVAQGGHSSNDIGAGVWEATSGTLWTISGSALTNSGTSATARNNEGPIAQFLDISSITDTSLNQLQLDVNFTTATASEKLFLHLRGYILGTVPGSPVSINNNGATNGNSWNDAHTNTDWTIYNLHSGQLNNHPSDYSWSGAAYQLSDGVAGAHSLSETFDMSGYAAEANNIANFDYLGIIITRDALGTSPSVSIQDFSLTAVPEPGSLALLTLGGLLIARRRRA